MPTISGNWDWRHNLLSSSKQQVYLWLLILQSKVTSHISGQRTHTSSCTDHPEDTSLRPYGCGERRMLLFLGTLRGHVSGECYHQHRDTKYKWIIAIVVRLNPMKRTFISSNRCKYDKIEKVCLLQKHVVICR